MLRGWPLVSAIAPPLRWLPVAAQRRLLWRFGLIGVAAFATMAALDGSLRTVAAPGGIVSFELCRTTDACQGMLDSWSIEAKYRAALSLGIDYLAMLSYSVFLALACLRSAAGAAAVAPGIAAFAAPVAWGQLAAGALDAVENLALIRMLLGAVTDGWALLAWAAASVKFGLVAIGIAYTIACLFLAARAGRHSESTGA